MIKEGLTTGVYPGQANAGVTGYAVYSYICRQLGIPIATHAKQSTDIKVYGLPEVGIEELYAAATLTTNKQKVHHYSTGDYFFIFSSGITKEFIAKVRNKYIQPHCPERIKEIVETITKGEKLTLQISEGVKK